jgi:hypothetical protein
MPRIYPGHASDFYSSLPNKNSAAQLAAAWSGKAVGDAPLNSVGPVLLKLVQQITRSLTAIESDAEASRAAKVCSDITCIRNKVKKRKLRLVPAQRSALSV